MSDDAKKPRTVASMVERDHEMLHAGMHELAGLVAAPVSKDRFADWKLDLLWRLRDFQNSLQKHFDLEEESAYKSELLRLAPQFAGQLDHLEDEHRRFIRDLTSVLGYLKGMQRPDSPDIQAVRAGFAAIVLGLEEHEGEERTLIQDVFYQDYGAGD
jgi:hypothetical protein